jgi:hypothetical protein
MRIRNLLLLALLAALTFGGTFTCTSSTDDHDHVHTTSMHR